MASPGTKNNIAILMYIVGFLDLFGVSMVIPLLSKHTRELGASPAVAGLIGSVYGGLQLFSSPLVGQWSDLSGRRVVLLWCLFMSAIGYFLLGMAGSLMLLVLARIPAGLFKHSQELSRGILADHLPKSQHSSTFGHFNSASSIGFIVGPILGGHLAESEHGFSICSAICASIFLLALGCFKHTQTQAKTVLSDLFPRPDERSRVQGRLNACGSVGFIVGPALSGHVVEHGRGFPALALTAAILFTLNFGLFKHSSTVARACLADVTSRSRHAHVFGRYNAATSLPFIVGPVIGGHLAEHSQQGFRIVASLCALCFLLDMVLVWFLVPNKEDTEPLQQVKENTRPTLEAKENKKESIKPTKNSKQKVELKENGRQVETANNNIKSSHVSLIKSFNEIDWTNLWDLFLLRFFLGFSMLVYRSNFSMLLDYKYAASPKTIGYVVSYGAVVGTVSGFFVGRIARLYADDSARMLLHTSVVQVLTIGGMGAAPSLWLLVVCMTPLSLATAVARVASTNLTIARGEAAGGTGAGALLGLGASVLSVARMCSPALGGLAQELHVSGPAILGAIFAALGVVVMVTIPQDPETRRKLGYGTAKDRTTTSDIKKTN